MLPGTFLHPFIKNGFFFHLIFCIFGERGRFLSFGIFYWLPFSDPSRRLWMPSRVHLPDQVGTRGCMDGTTAGIPMIVPNWASAEIASTHMPRDPCAVHFEILERMEVEREAPFNSDGFSGPNSFSG